MPTRRTAISGALALAGLAVGRPASGAERLLSAAEVRADVDAILPTIRRIHPDLAFTADVPRLEAQVGALRRGIDRPMNVREAWRLMAPLNALFRDAHVGLRHPVAQFDAYRESGGAAFPVPVTIDRMGGLRVHGSSPPGGLVAPLERIEAINGRPGAGIVAEMTPLMRGETQSLQRFVMAVNFPGLLWTLYGPQEDYSVEVRAADGRTRTLALPRAEAPLRPHGGYALRWPAPRVAHLRVGSFDPALKDVFATFLDVAFAEIAARRADTLIIDVRDNAGGAHDLSDLLVARVADRSVSPASTLVARITRDNGDLKPGAAVGDVVSVPFDEPIAPAPPERRFRGKVHVLVSRDTYSQAIVFAVTLKDHGLATVVGETTGGNANETGQITLTPLPNSGLQVLAPLYIIYRPSGDRRAEGLRPDVPLPHDPLAPDAMVTALLARS